MIKVNVSRAPKARIAKSYQEDVSRIHNYIHNKTGEGNDFLGWVNYPQELMDYEFKKIKTIANKVIKDCDTLVVIGIGGSYLGPKAAIEAINGLFYESKVKIIYLGNTLSPTYTAQVLKYLENKKFAINVISKSGSTLESSIAFRLVKELAMKIWGPKRYAKYVIVTTDAKKGSLRKMVDAEGYDSFIIPGDIGGRYSVFTPVGLFPMAVAGLDIEEFIDGAKDGIVNYSNENILENEAYKYAVARNLLYKANKKVEFFITYEPHFVSLAEWWKQLFGESEGKNGGGILPASLNFTTDLHSMGQFCQDGSDLFFETSLVFGSYQEDVIIPKTLVNIDNLNYLGNKPLSYVNDVAIEATIDAHFQNGNRNNIVLEMPKMTTRSLGELFYFLMMSCACSAYLLKINPFNQPGVEIYKSKMKEILKK